jgi:phosphohistidine phosphatase SixA
MKNLSWKFLITFFFAVSFAGINARCVINTKTTTIIIVRHAEKATTEGKDPELTTEGKQRAERLSASFPGVSPDAFYSTDYIRTKHTLEPWAKQTSKEIQSYDATKQPEFAESLLKQPGKTIVIAGHSNTVCRLVNLLLNEEKYKDLADSEYDKIFVVTIENNKKTVKVLSY